MCHLTTALRLPPGQLKPRATHPKRPTYSARNAA